MTAIPGLLASLVLLGAAPLSADVEAQVVRPRVVEAANAGPNGKGKANKSPSSSSRSAANVAPSANSSRTPPAILAAPGSAMAPAMAPAMARTGATADRAKSPAPPARRTGREKSKVARP